MGNITINQNKTLGSVIYILEGSQDEFYIFRKIFENIFNASGNVVVCRSEKTDLREFIAVKNKDSKIFLINSSSSSITSISDEVYLQKIFNKIVKEFNIDYNNSFVYYIWDRDKGNNSKIDIKNYFDKFYNSQETGYDMHGLLLLSYPCIESFLISCFSCEQINIPINIKKYIKEKDFKANHINEEKFKLGILNFLKSYQKIVDKEFDINEVTTNMKKTNKTIFDFEENFYKENSFYYYFSTIIISMIDLGIIEITQ